MYQVDYSTNTQENANLKGKLLRTRLKENLLLIPTNTKIRLTWHTSK
jgi:hypothetical protein